MLAFFKDDWVPFVCSTDISIQISATKTRIRTRGDGHWQKFTYQDVNFVITLSGLLKFDTDNFTGWDLLNSQIGFSQVLCRISFDDENGDVRTVQGYVMIETSTVGFSPGQLVKNDFQLQGSGSLAVFDGLVPCPTVITGITVNGQLDADGVVHITYTYSGDIYQVKYRIDNQGDYVYAVGDLTLDVPGLSLGSHSVEIIPICVNGYEGTGATQGFIVTQALVCPSDITGATITCQHGLVDTPSSGLNIVDGMGSPSIVFAMSGPATLFYYFLDFGSIFTYGNAGDAVSLAGLSPGNHTISAVPVCDLGGGQQVIGTGASYTFHVAANPSQSIVTYNYTNFPPDNSFNLYVNGILVVSSGTANASGSISVPVGATIKAVLETRDSKTATLHITDTTTSASLYNTTTTGPIILQYSYLANGDNFTINATVSP